MGKHIPATKTNVLFIRLRLLGDIIFTIPALELYRHRFPDHRIHYVVEEEFADVSDIIPYIDETIVLPRKMSLRDHRNFRKKIKNLHIQQVIDFHSGPKSALLTRITGARMRIGYRTSNRNWAFTHLVDRRTNDAPRHSVFNQARLLAPLGISWQSIPPYPAIQIKKEQTSKTFQSLLRSRPDITIHIGAKTKFRDWGAENHLALIRKLEKDGHVIFLIGQHPEEQKRGSYLAKNCRAQNLTGKLTITDMLYLISRSRVYFGVDSGPLHLASLTATPLVAIFGPNIPEISGPWRKTNVTILQADLDCIPCSQKKCRFETIKCILYINVDQVYRTINHFL